MSGLFRPDADCPPYTSSGTLFPLRFSCAETSNLPELTTVAGSEGEPLFFNKTRDMLPLTIASGLGGVVDVGLQKPEYA